ncbi:MAG TPA: hypothetical protein VJX67_21210 [Blastocatellia bacterium]|nr:hypothetical protein [Blastocatellia bacterium]
MNKNKPHVLVIPEDDANGRIARGFLLGLDNTHRVQILRPARGWLNALQHFNSYHAAKMRDYRERYCVLLIDFDSHADRLKEAAATIPADLEDRVFIIGALTEPEDLRKSLLKSYERIGADLANDCRDDTYSTWNDTLLQHNAAELERLRQHVRPILFG